jgi:hypothetical protein
VIDATGFSGSLKTAMEIVRPAGWITKVGWGPQPFNHSLDSLVQKNVRLQGSFSHNWPIWERVIQLLSSGRLNIDPIIGGHWKLDRWKEAFETMHSGEIVKGFRTQFGSVIANGQGSMKGKIFRIAHLGYFDFPDLFAMVAELEIILASKGIPVEFGTGVAVVQKVYAEAALPAVVKA